MLLDEAMDGIRSAFDSAVQRSADTLQNSRSYMDRARLRSQLNDAYRALGKAQYEAAMVGVENMADINSIISEITAIRQSLDEIERSLHKGTPVANAPQNPANNQAGYGAQPGVTYCPSCGKQNPAEFSFCSGCGAQLVK